MEVNFDLGGLANAIINGFISALTNFFDQLPQHIAENIKDLVQPLWNDIWNSQANLLVPPLSESIDFGPVRATATDMVHAAVGIVLLAMVLLAIKTALSGFIHVSDPATDAVSGILLAAFLAGSSVVLLVAIWTAFTQLGTLIARTDFTSTFNTEAGGYSLIISIIMFIVVLVFGIRLAFRAAKRIVLLGVLTMVAPVAAALWAIPQTRWISVSWLKAFSGLMIGGLLAALCVSLGVQLAIAGTGIVKIIYSAALLSLAGDLMAWLGGGGGLISGGPRLFGGMSLGGGGGGGSGAAVTAGAATGGAAVGAAATAAAASGNENGYGWQ